ncbi:hypothetical protein BLJ79_09125 [Arthrobacter sp. UCD-GKA]|nr:hypothetical protein BLJ79_09125 [Arthrobacter sp. UCD-GKA]
MEHFGAEFDGAVLITARGQDAPAHAVACLQYEDFQPAVFKRAGSAKTGHTRSDNDYIQGWF